MSHHERLGLCHMRFPTGELIGSVDPDVAFAGSQDAFGYDFHFIGDDRVLAWQADLALYEFDLSTLRPRRAVLSGIGDRTFGEGRFFSGQSWTLAGHRLLTSDRQYGAGAFRPGEFTLRLWDASALYAPDSQRHFSYDSAAPKAGQADRPFTRHLLASYSD